MRLRLVIPMVAVVLVAAACSDSDDPSEPAGSGVPSSTIVAGGDNSGALIPVTDDEDAATTSTAAPTTTGSVTSAGDGSTTTAPATTAAPSTSAAPTTVPVSSEAKLEDGQPATWFGVRDGASTSFVEERDSLDGSLKRELDRFALGSDYAPVSVDVSSDRIALGFCCEPVSGETRILQRINGNELVTATGSEPAFAPTPPFIVTVGYADGGIYALVNSNSGVAKSIPIVADNGDRAAWSLDGTKIALEVGSGIAVATYDPEAFEIIDVGPTLAPPAGTTWSKPAFQASGNLVVAQDGSSGETTGVVLNAAALTGLGGQLVTAEFSYGGEVVHQIYDDAGAFLIYVLDDGSVRWLGNGAQGELAGPGSGYLAAAW